MATTLDTTPATMDVTTSMAGMWAVTFAAAIAAAGAASIGTPGAALFLATPPYAEAGVAGFVTNAVVSGTDVNVSWSGSVLTKGKTYRLETRATLNTGQVVEFLTTVRCVA